VSRVIVSTEDSEIKKVSLDWGAEVIDRPKELALDTSSTSEVIIHALRILEENRELSDSFALLQPTSPLRNSSHLKACLDLFSGSGGNCVISITEVEHHPYKCFQLKSGHLYPLFETGYLDRPRQMMPTVYRQNGAIYVLKTKAFLEKRRFFIEPAFPFIMDNIASIDIDTELDLITAEAILSRKK
jgi:CMP-N-acetylneuraminic acid synthetase